MLPSSNHSRSFNSIEWIRVVHIVDRSRYHTHNFQFHWMDSSIHSRFYPIKRYHWAFNSIEWILVRVHNTSSDNVLDSSFNSIEWIPTYILATLLYSSIPSFQFHWMDSNEPPSLATLIGDALSIPLNGFLNPMRCRHAWNIQGLSIPLNGFLRWHIISKIHLAYHLSIPLNGFLSWVNTRASRAKSKATFQFHWMDSIKSFIENSKEALLDFQFHWMDSWHVWAWRVLSRVPFQFHWMDSGASIGLLNWGTGTLTFNSIEWIQGAREDGGADRG